MRRSVAVMLVVAAALTACGSKSNEAESSPPAPTTTPPSIDRLQLDIYYSEPPMSVYELYSGAPVAVPEGIFMRNGAVEGGDCAATAETYPRHDPGTKYVDFAPGDPIVLRQFGERVADAPYGGWTAGEIVGETEMPEWGRIQLTPAEMGGGWTCLWTVHFTDVPDGNYLAFISSEYVGSATKAPQEHRSILFPGE